MLNNLFVPFCIECNRCGSFVCERCQEDRIFVTNLLHLETSLEFDVIAKGNKINNCKIEFDAIAKAFKKSFNINFLSIKQAKEILVSSACHNEVDGKDMFGSSEEDLDDLFKK